MFHRFPKLHQNLFNGRDENGNTPLHIAVMQSNKSLVRVLLGTFDLRKIPQLKFSENGAPVFGSNNKGTSPIHTAVKNGDLEIVQLLLNSDLANSIISTDGDGNSPLRILSNSKIS